MRDIANEIAAENERLKEQEEALPSYGLLVHQLGKDAADCVIAERVKWADVSAELLSSAEGVLNAWEKSKDQSHPRSAMALMRTAIGPLYGAVLDIKKISAEHNPNPEAKIEQMIHELAYERVKQSYLFNVLGNEMVDRKADELAAQIARLVEQWILREVTLEAERQTN